MFIWLHSLPSADLVFIIEFKTPKGNGRPSHRIKKDIHCPELARPGVKGHVLQGDHLSGSPSDLA
jgi:hypothetical protein